MASTLATILIPDNYTYITLFRVLTTLLISTLNPNRGSTYNPTYKYPKTPSLKP